MSEIFISHDSIEIAAALAVKSALEALGHRAFVAGEDIELGVLWENQLSARLGTSSACIVLCSARSLRSHWVWMEFGAAALSDRRVIPAVLSDLEVGDLPEPFRRRQIVRLDTPDGCNRLLRTFGAEDGDAGRRLHAAVKQAMDWRRVRPEPGPPRAPAPAFAIDLAHRQGEWPEPTTAHQHAFDGFGRLDGPLTPDAASMIGRVHVVPLTEPTHLFRGHLSDGSGLVVVSPWRAAFSNEVLDEIEAWVKIGGGRLLLQGSQYGDRHHDANLNALGARFGVRFGTDIVAPATHGDAPTGMLRKPYGVPVTFPVGPDAHPLVEGVEQLVLANVQTVSIEPGGRILANTADNLVCEPPSTVRYNNGRFIDVARECQSRGPHPWLGALALAPRPLTGNGEVVAMGSWQLAPGENEAFIDRLLAWLGGA